MFKKSQAQRVLILQDKRFEVLHIFVKTKEDLNNLNEELDVEIGKSNAEIDDLKAKISEQEGLSKLCSSQKDANVKTIKKIDMIIT